MQVALTPTHLAIVMEYAAGGELFDRICRAGRFSEAEVSYRPLSPYYFSINLSRFGLATWLDGFPCLRFGVQARYFFQQLISGVDYCHFMVMIETPHASCLVLVSSTASRQQQLALLLMAKTKSTAEPPTDSRLTLNSIYPARDVYIIHHPSRCLWCSKYAIEI